MTFSPDARAPLDASAQLWSTLTEPWRDGWRLVEPWGRAALFAAAFFHDPRQTRRAWLADLSAALEGYVRSPAFLGWMAHSQTLAVRSAELLSVNRSTQEISR